MKGKGRKTSLPLFNFMNSFFKQILSSESAQSAKRFVTLIICAHFVIAAFVILFLVCYMVAVVPKGVVNKDLLNLLGEILKDDMYVILSGLGFIGLENWGQIQLEKAKAIASANIATGLPSADTIRVNTVNVDNIKKEPEDAK